MSQTDDETPLDPRIHPYRDDLAADFLEGRVEAKAFVPGQERRTGAPWTPVMSKPVSGDSVSGFGAADILQDTELLFGEAFTVFEDKDGWSWGQCGSDGYVGYVKSADLFATLPEPTHWVSAVRSLVFPDNKGEFPPLMSLSMMAGVAVDSVDGEYARLASGGWMFEKHLAALGDTRPDYIATASMFNRTPYLWGGRGGQGIDCSGLIQVPLAAAGIAAPRDSDQQADSIGEDLGVPGDLSVLLPGDIIFFPGHVGFYLGSGALLHASSHDMMVATHSLDVVVDRITERKGRGVTRVRRVVQGG
ncbi:MAG: C40 family peptidase [Alphaproteobacteria bacterium]|nr:C40 family peptidase [Alphaproteobacteria bacterium]